MWTCHNLDIAAASNNLWAVSRCGGLQKQTHKVHSSWYTRAIALAKRTGMYQKAPSSDIRDITTGSYLNCRLRTLMLNLWHLAETYLWLECNDLRWWDHLERSFVPLRVVSYKPPTYMPFDISLYTPPESLFARRSGEVSLLAWHELRQLFKVVRLGKLSRNRLFKKTMPGNSLEDALAGQILPLESVR